jgi:uncharacterized protein
MNAPNALSQDRNAAERKAYEPSMEEILASIRRIIADDQAVPPRPVAEPAALAPAAAPTVDLPEAAANASAQEEADGWTEATARPPIRLTPAAAVQNAPPAAPPPRSSFDFRLGQDFRLSPRATEAERPVATREAPPAPSSRDSLVERRPNPRRLAPGPQPVPAAAAAPEEALVSPATDAMVSQAFNTLIASRFLQSNDVMGEMVREMLRPMLKAWLDDNLPILVERLVRAEIERVARGGR